MMQFDNTAWLQLTHNKSRFLMSLFGVGFSVLLMFITLGLRDAMFEDAVRIHKTLDADLIIMKQDSEAFWYLNSRYLPRSLLYSLSAIAGIDSINPLYITWGNLKNPENFVNKLIGICAFNPDKPVFKLLEIDQNISFIQKADAFLFDRLSRPEYGRIGSLFAKQGQVITELSQKRIKISGLFSLGGSIFSADGILITSDINYSKILDQPLEKVNLGLVKINHQQSLNIIKQKISQRLPTGIKVVSLSEFIENEKQYWNKSTPVGFIFNLLSWVGFIFGGFIVYQILFVQIAEYLSVYATFKALGYSQFYIIVTVFQEAMFMSIIGYIPASIVCIYTYYFIKNSSRLPMEMTLDRSLYVFVLTCVMCLIASTIAINKLRDADPVDLFK